MCTGYRPAMRNWVRTYSIPPESERRLPFVAHVHSNDAPKPVSTWLLLENRHDFVSVEDALSAIVTTDGNISTVETGDFADDVVLKGPRTSYCTRSATARSGASLIVVVLRFQWNSLETDRVRTLEEHGCAE